MSIDLNKPGWDKTIQYLEEREAEDIERIVKLQTARTREQRRYEIARDVLHVFAASDQDGWPSPPEAARNAVDCADALLAELDKPRAEAERAPE